MNDQKRKLARLLKKAQTGDGNSLQILCKELEQFMRRYFHSKFRDPEVVNDLSQETYLRFLKFMPAIKEPMKLKNFMLKVAFFVIQDYHREKLRIPMDELTESSVSGPVSTSTVPDRALEKVDLENAMMNLTEKTRQILMMKANGYKYEEIAEELDLSVSGVKMQVKRGMEKLKISLFSVTFLTLLTTINIEQLIS